MNQPKVSSESKSEWLEIGTIVSAHGLKGELKISPDSDFPERFLVSGTRWLQNQKTGEITTKKLIGGRYIPSKNMYVIALEGVNYRDQAEALRDYKILVENSDRLALEADEFHVRDMLDLQVFNKQTGENIGVVTNVFSAGNDLLEVTLHKQPEAPTAEKIEQEKQDLAKISRRSKRKKFKKKPAKIATILIPFVEEIVPIIDLQEQRIEINPPEGLLKVNDHSQDQSSSN